MAAFRDPAALWHRANLTDRLFLAYFVLLGLAIVLFRHLVPGWPSFILLHLVFIALILLLAAGARRFPTAHAWYPIAMPLMTFHEIAQLNLLFVDRRYDHMLLAFEAQRFPEPPTVWLGRIASLPLTELLGIGYLSYFVLLPVVAFLLYARADKTPFFGVMAATILAYFICYVVFLAFPTIGPAHTLRHLHTQPLPGGPMHWLVLFTQQAGVYGNAFPSAHVAGAMPPLVFSWRYLRGLAPWLTVLVALMCAGAVYYHYHYASDVIAGIPIGLATAIAFANSASGKKIV